MSPRVVRRVFLGSLVRIVSTITLSLGALAGGAFATGLIGLPALERVDNEFGEVTDERTEIVTHLTVTNPNPVGLSSVDLAATYTVSMNGVPLAEGRTDSLALEPGTSSETLTTWMANDRIPDWWVTHIERGEVSEAVVEAEISSGALGRATRVSNTQPVETDLVSSFDSDERRPIDANSPLVSDPLLYVERTRANWSGVDDRHTELDLRFDLYNPQAYDVPITRLGYEISMNDVVVGDGESAREYLLRAGRTTTVETTTRIVNGHLDDWWVSHLQNGEVTDLRIEFDARVRVLGTTISLPLEALTYEETIETDILGTDDEPDDGTERATNEGDGSERGADDSDGDGGERAAGDSEAEDSSDDSDTGSDGDGGERAAGDSEVENSSDGSEADGSDGDDSTDGGLLSGLPLSSDGGRH
ncbi:LEA/WHy family protein [Natronobiforma cellulositropha]|uniref:LEA type 2 family protein n=1 Tax=Natronobiforma cellulositropha TaxID=1679076 RepID=UPI0021D5F1DF|nr:LEA type 2 family protein [Natronobiforma cellulositropha]